MKDRREKASILLPMGNYWTAVAGKIIFESSVRAIYGSLQIQTLGGLNGPFAQDRERRLSIEEDDTAEHVL